MVVKFKDFIDFDKPIGKMMIIGNEEGVGKTLLSCAIQVTKMLHGRVDRRKSYRQVNEYNSYGYKFSKNYEHLCFSNYACNCKGTRRPSLKNYVSDPFRTGLYCKDYATDLYPPGTCLFYTEAQRIFNAYMWPYIRPEIRAYWESGRQADISLVIDTNKPRQVIGDIRGLCNRIIFLHKKCKELVKDGRVVGNILYIYEFNQWADVEKYLDNGALQNYKKYELRLDKCYYRNYDSYQCRLVHLKGRVNQDFKVEYFYSPSSIEDIEKFADNFGINAPPGYFKKSSKFEEKEEKKNIESQVIVDYGF